jgi:protein-S-isoprenylcysteine O-methyltransferase Ste14
MYVGLLIAILGQTLLFTSLPLLAYAAAAWAATAAFVRWYEEPTLRRTYGEEYDAYTRQVRAWVPRLK